MKHLKLKKIKIAQINNLSMILGGNNRETIVQGCMEDTHTCPPKKTQDPADPSCEVTNAGTRRTQGNIANTDTCG